MAITITDTSTSEWVEAGKSGTPLTGMVAATTDGLNDIQTVTVVLGSATASNQGTLKDPNGGGSFSTTTNTFTESGLVGGSPDFATQLLQRLVYSAPNLAAGQSSAVPFTITVTDTLNGVQVSTATFNTFPEDVVTSPSITGSVLNQPVASGQTVSPFATTVVTDYNFNYAAQVSATVTVTDGGVPTDADGLLTGPGVSKSGTGTYVLNAATAYTLEFNLERLVFTAAAIPAGQPDRTATFALTVTDTASSALKTSVSDSVRIIAPPMVPSPPNIAGVSANGTVQAGGTGTPFKGISVSDGNASPQDRATIVVTDAAGKTTDANGTFAGEPWLSHADTGTYTIAAAAPSQLASELAQLSFTPSSQTTNFALTVINAAGTATATTSLTEQPAGSTNGSGGMSAGSASDFLIQDQTTGQTAWDAGSVYTGPVSYLTKEIIHATSDQVTITAYKASVFVQVGMQGGSNPAVGGINVSVANGDNVLDSYANSSFLTNGSGTDQDYLDVRGLSQNMWSTVVNFHSGDNITLWGVTQNDFSSNWIGDTQGAAGYTGLTGVFAPKAGGNVAGVTLAGFKMADLTNGKLAVSYGAIGDTSYASIHAN